MLVCQSCFDIGDRVNGVEVVIKVIPKTRSIGVNNELSIEAQRVDDRLLDLTEVVIEAALWSAKELSAGFALDSGLGDPALFA
jgi:hypothetical protein